MCVYAQLFCCELCCIATHVSIVNMSAMEAIASVRAKAKTKGKPNHEPVLKKMKFTPQAKAVAADCADLAAYKNEGEVKVRASILEARKQEQEYKRMYHKQRVMMADDK